MKGPRGPENAQKTCWVIFWCDFPLSTSDKAFPLKTSNILIHLLKDQRLKYIC